MTANNSAPNLRKGHAELLHEFGGEGPVVHLAHANGFPPGSYRLLADALVERYRVIALPSRALWPGSQPETVRDWRALADDLILGLDELGLRGILGIGHSIGGVLTMWAAIRRPDLFRAVVLIDPVILPPAWLLTLRVMRCVGLYWRQPLVQGALRRRRVWPSQPACYESYWNKPLFANWPEASLRAYVEAGTRPRADGQVELVYSPEWEARIFATSPVDVWRDVAKLRAPALIIRGEQSNTFRPECPARMKRLLPNAHYVVIPGAGHLAPLERPAETGAAIRAFLDSF